jgi:hypothetical protein
VLQANTATSLTSNHDPSIVGQAVTFTATTTPVAPGGGIPTGGVTFKDGATVLATMTLNASGQATFTTSTLTLGTHSITATYSGDANFAGSNSASLSQGVFAYGATAWIGLKNSDDQGTQFDLRAEVYRNGAIISSGESRCITGVTRNPDLAKEVAVALTAFTESLAAGDQLSVKFLTRVGTNPDGSKCSGPGGSHDKRDRVALVLRRRYPALAPRPEFWPQRAPQLLPGCQRNHPVAEHHGADRHHRKDRGFGRSEVHRRQPLEGNRILGPHAAVIARAAAPRNLRPGRRNPL